MMPPTSIDGTDITGATIDGQDVQEITVDGDTVFTAGPPEDIAKFNTGSLDAAFTGDRSDFSVVTSPVLEGSHSLEDSGGGGESIYASSGLPDLPGPGDTFAVYVRGTGTGNFAGMSFGGADEDNCYRIRYGNFGSTPRLERIDAGSKTDLANGSASIPGGDWFDLEVDFGAGGSITAKIFSVNQTTGARITQLSSATATDSTHTSAGLGFSAEGGSGVNRWDNARLI